MIERRGMYQVLSYDRYFRTFQVGWHYAEPNDRFNPWGRPVVVWIQNHGPTGWAARIHNHKLAGFPTG